MNFPTPIQQLPIADIPIPGARAYLSQGDDHQILFMTFSEDVLLPEHRHEAQWGIVLEGAIQLTIGEEAQVYQKGDRYFIPAGVPHSGKIFAGYSDVTFFAQGDRYGIRAALDS